MKLNQKQAREWEYLNDLSDDEFDKGDEQYPMGKLGEPVAMMPYSLVYELDRLIEYNREAEHQDYATAGHPSGHIYESISKLSCWTFVHLDEAEGYAEAAGAQSRPELCPASSSRGTVKRSHAHVEHTVRNLPLCTAVALLQNILLALLICRL